jgi:hypothetical protein
VFRINIKLLSNPVAEQKIRENDSHCRSIVLTTKFQNFKNIKNSKIKKEFFLKFKISKFSEYFEISKFEKIKTSCKFMSKSTFSKESNSSE